MSLRKKDGPEQAGLEVAPSDAPIAKRPVSGLEAAPSDGLIARNDYSDLEAVQEGQNFPIGNAKEANPEDDGTDAPQARVKAGRICGFRPVTFWLSLALLIVVLGAAIGGGVGGSLSNNDSGSQPASSPNRDSSNATDSTSPTSQRTDSPSASASQTSTAVTSGVTGIAALDCTNGTIYATAAGARYREFCKMDWPTGFAAIGGGFVDDVQAVTVYTFESCMNACDSFNVQRDGECKGVTYNADLSTSLGFSGGNCILKSKPADGGSPAGTTVASAAIVRR